MGILRNIVRRKVKETANRHISQNDNILEIGCGDRPHYSRSKKIDLIYDKDVTQGIEYKDNYFDAVIMEEVIEHIDRNKTEYVISEIKRVLKPKGIFIFSTPNKYLYHIWLIGRYDDNLKKVHIAELTFSELRTLLNKYFNKVLIKPSRFFPGLWGYAIKKN